MKSIKREDIPARCPDCEADFKSYQGPGPVTRLICSERCNGFSETVTIDHSAEANGDTDAIILYT